MRVRLAVDGKADRIAFTSQNGWNISLNGQSAVLHGPSAPKPGLTNLQAAINENPAWQMQFTDYPHIGRTVWREPAVLPVLVLDVKLPNARIGYIGGGADNVDLWLKRMGFDMTDLEAHHLAGDLSQFTTIVVGIFAFGIRDDLAAATARLHRFVEDGGHLVTLYHRPSDGWHPDQTPPRKLTIGSPRCAGALQIPMRRLQFLSLNTHCSSAPMSSLKRIGMAGTRSAGFISLPHGTMLISRCFQCMMMENNRFMAHLFRPELAKAVIRIRVLYCTTSSTNLSPVLSV